MGFDKYILIDGQPVVCDDVQAWGWWFETHDRRVESTTIGDVRISTVFLGVDHQFSIGPPVLWETMIFGGEHDSYQARYASVEDARRGHAYAVAMVEANIAADGH